jgi:hypothetical protein
VQDDLKVLWVLVAHHLNHLLHAEDGSDDEPPTPTTPSGRPALTRVK